MSNKRRLFEVMGRLDNKFKTTLNENLNLDVLNRFKETPIYNNKYIITGFDVEERVENIGVFEKKYDLLIIQYSSPRGQEYNKSYGSMYYRIDKDEFSYIMPNADKNTMNILSQIARTVNPESRYLS